MHLLRLISRFFKRDSAKPVEEIINWDLPTTEENIENRFRILESNYWEKLEDAIDGKDHKPDFLEEVHGNYSIEGHNAGYADKGYFGELELKRIGGKLYKAFWKIGFGNQQQKGVGFRFGDKLALDFYYTEEGQRFYGLVIYQLVAGDLLRGYWIEPGVEGVGFEECRLKNRL